MEELTKEEQERLGKYTHSYKALWDNYLWKLEAHEHRKNTIGLESTPEEKIMIEEFKEWADKQPWNLEEQDTTNELNERREYENNS